MFEAIYASGFHNPGLFWLAAFVLVLVVAARLPFLYGFLLVFAFEIAADALASGALSPVPKDAAYGTPLSIVFVILGDLRYFVLFFGYGKGGAKGPLTLRIVGFSLLVPVFSAVAGALVPALGSPLRVTFLTYELMFFALSLTLRGALARGLFSSATPEIRRFLRLITTFELVQYGLWALADVVILQGIDAGYLLRLAPNTMYYALFLPFVLWAAPSRERPVLRT